MKKENEERKVHSKTPLVLLNRKEKTHRVLKYLLMLLNNFILILVLFRLFFNTLNIQQIKNIFQQKNVIRNKNSKNRF